jgi:hypothetical protein
MPIPQLAIRISFSLVGAHRVDAVLGLAKQDRSDVIVIGAGCGPSPVLSRLPFGWSSSSRGRLLGGNGNIMKTIGLLGGMSWESTVTYYQIINEAVRERLGGPAFGQVRPLLG